jgi:uncharacterized protein
MSEDNTMTEMFEGRNIVLSSMVGSWAANLNTPESDKDWKHFVAPSFDDLYAGKMFATASVSETLDYDVHDIRQLGSLLWKANLNFISVLFGHETSCVPELRWIFDNADSLAVMNLPYFYNATMGMHFEKMSTLMKGTGNTQVLIERYGYDTKQATHALRCLYVLERFMKCGNMRYALFFENGWYRDTLLNIKRGWVYLEDFKAVVNAWHTAHKEETREWYSACLPNVEVKNMLDEGIKNFIRANL